MKRLVWKSGSNATPSRPRSPEEFTPRVRNGCTSNALFFTTRNVPPCSETKTRPSGAMAMAVGFARPAATRVSENPAGNVAALDIETHSSDDARNVERVCAADMEALLSPDAAGIEPTRAAVSQHRRTSAWVAQREASLAHREQGQSVS